MVEIKRYGISNIEQMSVDIKKFTLQGSGKLVFKPGQFVSIYLMENGRFTISRPFSIASSPAANHLEFCIRIVGGQFTGALDKLKVGAELGVAGPFGHFAYEEQKECVFAVAGTGIAPIMSILRYVNEKRIMGDFILMYSNKTKDAILYYDELKKMQEGNPRIKLVFTLTRETPQNWVGECGRIDETMIKKHITRSVEKAWYLCGPLEFVKAIKECALAKGTAPDRIKIEGWG